MVNRKVSSFSGGMAYRLSENKGLRAVDTAVSCHVLCSFFRWEPTLMLELVLSLESLTLYWCVTPQDAKSED